MDQTHPPRRAIRSIAAVFAGLLALVILSIVTDMLMRATGIFQPDGQPMSDRLYLLATAYGIVYGVAGCYIAARLAPNRPMGHAVALGIIGVALGIVGEVATWDHGPEFGPRWYPIAIFAIPLPCAWA